RGRPGRLRRDRPRPRGGHVDGGRHRPQVLARQGQRHGCARPRADEGQGAGREDPEARPPDEADLPALPGDARAGGPQGPARSSVTEWSGARPIDDRAPLLPEAAEADPTARQMAGFKDFFQYASTTRVMAGRWTWLRWPASPPRRGPAPRCRWAP